LTLALAEHASPAKVPILWKTNGFLTARAIDLIAPVLDAVNIDVKAARERAHRELTGAPLAPVLDAVERFRAAGVWVEVSTPLIPGAASDPADLKVIARRIADVDTDMPWHLLRFSPVHRMADADPTPPAVLAAARRIGYEAGLRYVYVERALGPAGRDTCCPDCRIPLVTRGIWQTLTNGLVAGHCPGCEHPVPGKWKEHRR
jgi:pyruvate formate lyase activating enzyme